MQGARDDRPGQRVDHQPVIAPGVIVVQVQARTPRAAKDQRSGTGGLLVGAKRMVNMGMVLRVETPVAEAAPWLEQPARAGLTAERVANRGGPAAERA